jgi:hippurate hydrolase
MIEEGMKRIARGICEAFDAELTFDYRRGYPATVNHGAQAELAAEIAAGVVGADNIRKDVAPVMGAEDFSFMLQERPGAYLWLGQAGGPSACMVHNPRYDFNDEVLPVGASVFATMVETRLDAAE